jgi:hypothetical protein
MGKDGGGRGAALTYGLLTPHFLSPNMNNIVNNNNNLNYGQI